MPQQPAQPGEPLSPREKTVLVLTAGGMTNETIGRRLGISEATVATYMKRSFIKLSADSRTHAVVLAFLRNDITMTDLATARFDEGSRRVRIRGGTR